MEFAGRAVLIAALPSKLAAADAELNVRASGSTRRGGDPLTILDGNVVNSGEKPNKPPPGHGCGERGTADLNGQKFPCPDEVEPESMSPEDSAMPTYLGD